MARLLPAFYLLFALAGMGTDTWMFSFTRQDYYAVTLMRMNALERGPSGFIYAPFKSVARLTTAPLALHGFIAVPWWLAAAMALAPADGKTAMNRADDAPIRANRAIRGEQTLWFHDAAGGHS